MGRRRFVALLRGLSGESVWRHVLAAAPKVLDSDSAARVMNRM